MRGGESDRERDGERELTQEKGENNVIMRGGESDRERDMERENELKKTDNYGKDELI